MTLKGTLPSIFQTPSQGPQPQFIYELRVAGYEKRYLVQTQAASPGNPMGPLRDLSGTGQADLTGVNLPTMRLEGNSYYAELDGVDDYIAAAGDPTQKPRTVYTVQRIRALPASPKFLWVISTSQLILYVNTDNQLYIRNLTNSTNTATGLFITIGKWHVFSLLNNGNIALASLDGQEAQFTLTGLTGNAGQANVGTTSTAPNSGPVDFKEWIMYAVAQGISSRVQVVDDLLAAHNIA